MRRKSFANMTCPIARTLEIVGEWWTLIIVRDALMGARRFEEFRRTGIADNILSVRLERLVAEGILERRGYQEHPPRHEYLLTDKGRDLLPIVVAIGAWGMRWTDIKTTQPLQLLHTQCGTEVGFDLHCPTCSEVAPPREIELRRSGAPPGQLRPDLGPLAAPQA